MWMGLDQDFLIVVVKHANRAVILMIVGVL